jgi:predicted neuraminidase
MQMRTHCLLPGFAFLVLLGLPARAAPRALVESEYIYDTGPYPSCHASTIAETPRDGLVAAWFGGSAESHPDVAIYSARREGGRWTPSRPAADGVQADGVRFACWNPVLFQPRSGPLLLFYKVGPSPERWWGMLKTSEDGGRSWGQARRLPAGILGPIKNKPIQLADGTILCGSSAEQIGGAVWRVHLESTADLGRTWRVVGPLEAGGFNSIQPSILTYADGRLQLLCRSQEMTLTTSWSTDQGRSWTPLAASGLFNANSGSDAVSLSDGRQLLVYNPRSAGRGGPSSPKAEALGGGEPLVAGAHKDWGVRWPLVVSVSRDGRHWTGALTLEDKPCRFGYAYPAVIQTRDGLVHVTYTWNREKIKHIVIDPARL